MEGAQADARHSCSEPHSLTADLVLCVPFCSLGPCFGPRVWRGRLGIIPLPRVCCSHAAALFCCCAVHTAPPTPHLTNSFHANHRCIASRASWRQLNSWVLGRSRCWSRGMALAMPIWHVGADSRQRAFGGTPQRLGNPCSVERAWAPTSVIESFLPCSCTAQARMQSAQRQDTRPFERAAHDDMQHHGDTSVELHSGSMAVLAGASLGRNGGARGNPRGL